MSGCPSCANGEGKFLPSLSYNLVSVDSPLSTQIDREIDGQMHRLFSVITGDEIRQLKVHLWVSDSMLT